MMRERIFGKIKSKKWREMGTNAQRYPMAHDWARSDNKVKFEHLWRELGPWCRQFQIIKRDQQTGGKTIELLILLQIHIAEETKFGLDKRN
jgi:hypothetical protein